MPPEPSMVPALPIWSKSMPTSISSAAGPGRRAAGDDGLQLALPPLMPPATS
jgi:hypothetical protein